MISTVVNLLCWWITIFGIIPTYLQRLESDTAVAKSVEEQLEKVPAGVEVDTHNGCKFKEAEACTANYSPEA